PKYEISSNMEALIHHFKLYTEGYRPPAGDVYLRTESPKGELGFYLVSDGGPKPYRMSVRAPSFANLQALPLMIEGCLRADVVAVIGSIDIVLGEVDRGYRRRHRHGCERSPVPIQTPPTGCLPA